MDLASANCDVAKKNNGNLHQAIFFRILQQPAQKTRFKQAICASTNKFFGFQPDWTNKKWGGTPSKTWGHEPRQWNRTYGFVTGYQYY